MTISLNVVILLHHLNRAVSNTTLLNQYHPNVVLLLHHLNRDVSYTTLLHQNCLSTKKPDNFKEKQSSNLIICRKIRKKL